MGTAGIQGQLWSASPQDWAEVSEPQMRPVHQAAVDALCPLAGQALLDAGCGSGQLLRLAAAAGATVSGLDASAALLGVARGQLPDADLRTGDIGELPYDDSGFDVVTAFNAIQYAADPKTAVAELARVTRPGGRVLIGVWAATTGWPATRRGHVRRTSARWRSSRRTHPRRGPRCSPRSRRA
jgi:ubiquinone/menaquinone biosynthesis C-methylase UbiE